MIKQSNKDNVISYMLMIVNDMDHVSSLLTTTDTYILDTNYTDTILLSIRYTILRVLIINNKINIIMKLIGIFGVLN